MQPYLDEASVIAPAWMQWTLHWRNCISMMGKLYMIAPQVKRGLLLNKPQSVYHVKLNMLVCS